MRTKILIFLMAVLALTGCSGDEQSIENSLVPVPPTAGTNVVRFSNGTSITIGTPKRAHTHLATKATEIADNEACKIDMPECPNVPDNIYKVTDANSISSGLSQNSLIPTGTTIEAPIGFNNHTLYVAGKLVLQTNSWGLGTLIILEGGEVNCEWETISDGLTILNYGTFNVATDDGNFNINEGATFKTESDFGVTGELNTGAEFYVGGNLTCGNLDANGTLKVHVIGDLTLTDDEVGFSNNARVCVEGSMTAHSLTLSSAANLHVGCKLVTDKFTLANTGTVLTTGYIKSDEMALQTGDPIVRLDANGVIDVKDLYFENFSAEIITSKDGQALVNCENCHLWENYTISGIAPNIYFNYTKFYTGNKGNENEATKKDGILTSSDEHDITISTDKINQANINESTIENQCNPGFTPDDEENGGNNEGSGDEGDNGDEGDEDRDHDLIIEIPNDIDQEWIAKADDFAIRIDGQYQDAVIPENNVVELNGIEVSEEGLVITLSGLENQEEDKEYTYELWLWVTEDSWNNFTEEQKKSWIEKGHFEGECKIEVPDSFNVITDVFAGVSGHEDAPYIKVSIHVKKK